MRFMGADGGFYETTGDFREPEEGDCYIHLDAGANELLEETVGVYKARVKINQPAIIVVPVIADSYCPMLVRLPSSTVEHLKDHKARGLTNCGNNVIVRSVIEATIRAIEVEK